MSYNNFMNIQTVYPLKVFSSSSSIIERANNIVSTNLTQEMFQSIQEDNKTLNIVKYRTNKRNAIITDIPNIIIDPNIAKQFSIKFKMNNGTDRRDLLFRIFLNDISIWVSSTTRIMQVIYTNTYNKLSRRVYMNDINFSKEWINLIIETKGDNNILISNGINTLNINNYKNDNIKTQFGIDMNVTKYPCTDKSVGTNLAIGLLTYISELNFKW